MTSYVTDTGPNRLLTVALTVRLRLSLPLHVCDDDTDAPLLTETDALFRL